jgi:hypothetical protein
MVELKPGSIVPSASAEEHAFIMQVLILRSMSPDQLSNHLAATQADSLFPWQPSLRQFIDLDSQTIILI